MFMPSQAAVSVLDAPCQITVEFTDYASYQHHQLRQQQYREELERQHLQQEEQQRHHERLLQQQQQQQQQPEHHIQQQPQQVYQQHFPPQPASYLPQQLPPDQRILVYQQQQQVPAVGIDAHGNQPVNYRRSDGTAIPLIGGNDDTAALSASPVSSVPVVPAVPCVPGGAAYGGSSVVGPPATKEAKFIQVHHRPPGAPPPLGLAGYPHSISTASVGAIKQEEQQHHQTHHLLHGLQHYPVAIVPPSPSIPSPSLSKNAAAPLPVPPPVLASAPTAALTATTEALPVVAPALAAAPYPASTVSSSQHRNSTAVPTFFPPAVGAPPALAPGAVPSPPLSVPPPPQQQSASTITPATTGTVASTPVSSSPVARQLHLRRQHHPNYNHNHHAASHHHHHQHLQQQIQRRRIVKGQALTNHPAGATYPNSTSTPPNSSLNHPHQPNRPGLPQQQQPQQLLGPAVYPPKSIAVMADSALPKADTNQAAIDAEIAAQEAAARDYRPDVNGPGINEIRSTEEIKDHYACADHIFVQKTVNLPRAYPLYRAVRGDGNCGWRAIGFCYFEALIHNGNAALIAEEKQRLLGLNDYIREVGGYDPYVYEDMVEETDILFEAILKALPDTEQAIRTLTDSFNDEGAGNAIIYHLRLLTASYLKGNVETYEGFIAHDGGVIGYCQEWIERPNCEIDHLRVEVLASILLKPSDIVLEIAYLDRSHGSNVTVYKFPDTNIGRLEETITMRISLLFRPDHYDILYRPSLPSRAVAEAVLLRFLPADAAMAALQPSVDMSVTGALPEQQPANDVPNPLVTSYLPAESVASDLVTQTFPAPTRYYDRIAQQVNTPSIPEDTPDLTPGSSSNSPAMFPVKEEPVTPAYASPAPPNVGQQQIASVHREVHGQGAASSVAGVAPTSTSGTSNNASVAKQGPTSAALSTPHPAPPPRSVHDRDVHHVGSVSYGGASQSIGRMGNFHSATSSNFQLLAHLPGMFGRFQTQPMSSSPLGPGPSSSWNVGAPGPSGFHKEIPSFSVSPVPPTSGGTDVMPSNSVPAVPASPVPSVIPGTPMSAGSHMDRYSDSYSEPAFSTAGTPGPMMEVPTPIPAAAMPYTGHTSHPVSQTGGGVDANNNGGPSNVSFLPEPKSTPVRFTKWHFNRLPHDATDPNSSLFRNSRVSTAHFDNPDFQPQEYDPSGGGGDAPSSRNRRKSSVLREYDDKKR